MLNDTFQHRRWVIAAIISAFVLVYIIQLFSLQILETKYKIGAESNALLRKTIYPPRGLIYDRNNTLLVYNKPAYDVAVIMREIQNLDTLALCNTLNISSTYFAERLNEIRNRRKNPGYSPFTPQILLTQLDSEDIAPFQEKMYQFPGFYIQNRTLREYAFPNGAHIFGSIGEVSRRDLESDSYYSLGDFSGRDGVEYTYEESLRGDKGVEILLRDSRGRIKGKYRNGELDVEPIAGANLTLTIDIQLQKIGEQLLDGKIGSAIAIEPKSGEILAMVTNPGYDPSILVGQKRSENYNQLVNDPTKPLMNRATQAQYSPGSTFKPLQALICLQMGGITEATRFTCNGTASLPIRCTHSHGSPVSLLNAIEQSCNPYFWQAFRSTLEKDGYGERNLLFKENFQRWADAVYSFGLGNRFPDSDIYEQSQGNIPTQSYYNRYFGETGWKSLTIRSLSIGQGELLVTPLQLANLMAAIANNGFYITPHLNKNDTMLVRKHPTHIDSVHFPVVKEGMWQVFEYGTGRYYKLDNIEMCGKTGTVQNNHGEDHSLFVGFAPKENPQIAIAVVVENAGYGSVWASPIASLMMEQYIRGSIERTELFKRISTSVTNEHVKKR